MKNDQITFPDARFLIDNGHPHTANPVLTPLHAAKKRESIKIKKYQQLAEAEDCKFIFFIQESYGGFGVEAKKFISELVRQSKQYSSTYSYSLSRFYYSDS